MTKTLKAAKRNAAPLKAKTTRGIPVRIVSSTTGKPSFEAHLLIIPDDAKSPPAKPFLPGMPEPMIVRRRQYACLLREWRNHPDTTWAERNFPTASDIIGMVIRRALAKEMNLNPVEA